MRIDNTDLERLFEQLAHEPIDVLLVSQDVSRLALFKRALEGVELYCLQCHSGAAALAVLQQRPVRVVLFIGSVRDMYGDYFVRMVRKRFSHMTLKIVTLSGNWQMRQRFLRAGADEFYAAPTDLAPVVHRVLELVRGLEFPFNSFPGSRGSWFLN